MDKMHYHFCPMSRNRPPDNGQNNLPKMTKIDLRRLQYSPNENPLLAPSTVPTRKRAVRSNIAEEPLYGASGELVAASVIRQIEEVDTDHFVKIFAQGIAAAYELTKTAHRTFAAILAEYEQQPMQGGFAEAVHLAWFNDGLCGRKININEKTFRRGMHELLEKKFIAPRMPNVYWVNPALFFKGDRVLFVKDYRRRGLVDRLDKRTLTLPTKEIQE